jgi:hypothetical protein
MGMTITEKIIADHAGKKGSKAGGFSNCKDRLGNGERCNRPVGYKDP